MIADSKILRILFERRSGMWTAICLDFDVSAQGETFTETMGRLVEAIDLFLEGVAELPADEQRALLRRRAPIGLWLKFCWAVFRDTLRGRRDDGSAHGSFLPCHA